MNTKNKNVQFEPHSLKVWHTHRRPRCAQDERGNARKSQEFITVELYGDPCVSEAKSGSFWTLSRMDRSQTVRNMRFQKFRALWRCS